MAMVFVSPIVPARTEEVPFLPPHPESEAPAGGTRLPIAHSSASPTRTAQGNRAPGATRSRAQEVAVGGLEHGEHGEDATLPGASTLASCRA